MTRTSLCRLKLSREWIQRLAGVVAATALLAGVSVTAASADTQWQRRYYEDYFKSNGTCVNRGNWIIGSPPYSSPGIQGIDAFKCYKISGDVKYSMDVRWYGRWATVSPDN